MPAMSDSIRVAVVHQALDGGATVAVRAGESLARAAGFELIPFPGGAGEAISAGGFFRSACGVTRDGTVNALISCRRVPSAKVHAYLPGIVRQGGRCGF